MSARQPRHFRKKGINFVGEPADHEYLKVVIKKVGLGRSETLRRAMRIGLQELEKLELPGGRVTRDDTLAT